MKGFVFVAIGLGLMYVALSGKAGDLIVALLTGQANTLSPPVIAK